MTGGHPFTPEDLGTPENPTRELTKATTWALAKRWGSGYSAETLYPQEAMRRWGAEHPELGWSP
jgi:hypothetical protein